MLFFSIILGCLLAFGIAFALVGFAAYKLNDSGNYKGRFKDFATTPLITKSRNDNFKYQSGGKSFINNMIQDSFIGMIKDSLEISDGNPFDNHHFH